MMPPRSGAAVPSMPGAREVHRDLPVSNGTPGSHGRQAPQGGRAELPQLRFTATPMPASDSQRPASGTTPDERTPVSGSGSRDQDRRAARPLSEGLLVPLVNLVPRHQLSALAPHSTSECQGGNSGLGWPTAILRHRSCRIRSKTAIRHAEFVATTVTEVFGADRYEPLAVPRAGSEDFSRVIAEVPGSYLFLGARPAGDTEPVADNPSPRARFDEAVLADGAHLHARLAIGALHRDANLQPEARYSAGDMS
jgi:hypothetical protein